MHGQGHYTAQAGQAPYQHCSFVAAPCHLPVPHHGPLPPQLHVVQQGHPSFHFNPRNLAYPNTVPSVPHHGPPVQGVSSGMSFNQSYVTCPRLPQGNASAQMSYSYPTSEQHPPWSQNGPQFPPAALIPARSVYPLAPPQERTVERGPPQQSSFHAAPPSQPPIMSISSSFSRPDSYGPSIPLTGQHSYPQAMGILPPPLPLPRPPPLPSSSPPVVPPLPPSSPPSDTVSKNDGNCLILGHSPPRKPVEDRSLHQVEDLLLHDEKIDNMVVLGDTIAPRSPGNSDMDMEDDITLLDAEKKTCLFKNSNDEHISTSEVDNGKEQLQDVQEGTHMIPKVDLEGSTVPEGSQVPSGAHESGRERTRQTEQPLDDSSFRHENPITPTVPIVNPESGYRNLSDQVNEGTNPFNLLQYYASDDNSENDDANLLGDGSSQSTKDGSKTFDSGKECKFGSELHMETVSEVNKNVLTKSMNEPSKVMEADKMSVGTGKDGKFSGEGSRGQEFDRHQLKDSSRNHYTNIGGEDANMYQSDIRSDPTKLNVDEFGRLIREGVSDSDISESPRYIRRQGRRARKRSRSQSPHDQRRRSPWRKEKRRRSPSWSPNSRSRSPVMRRGIEFTGDKLRQEKGQLPVCFAFLRGKCYRGTACRYSHHEPGKSDRKRYNRGKQLNWDKPPALQSPDYPEQSNAVPEKEVKHKWPRFPLEMSNLKEVNDAKDLPGDSTTHTGEKDENVSSLLFADVVASRLSGYSAHDVTLGKGDYLIPEPQVSEKIHRIIHQQGQQISDSLFSESSNMEASVATSTHFPADKPDVNEDPPRLSLHGNPNTKPYFTEEVPSVPLKELPPLSASHLSHSVLPLPSVSQVVTVSFTESRYHLTPEYSPFQAPASYQYFHFPGPLNSSSSSFVLPPPPPPPPSHSFSTNIMAGEQSFPLEHMQHSLLPSQEGLSSNACKGNQPSEYPNRSSTSWFQVYSTSREPDQRSHITNNFESSLNTRLGGSQIRGEERFNGHPVQGMDPYQSFAQAQPNYSLSRLSQLNGMQGSSRNPLSDSSLPYFQQHSHGQQYSVGSTVSSQFTDNGKVNSSISNITPGFSERNQPSYVHEILGSRISNYSNPYASTFDLPVGSKFNSNALTQETDLNTNTKYGRLFASASASGDGRKIGGTNMVSLSCGLPAEDIIPRPGGHQYDPLFDSIDLVSNSFPRVYHQNRETVGDSDDVLKLGGSGGILDMEGINNEGGVTVSLSDSVENEEFGETADAEVGAVLNDTPSYPNAATDMNTGEVEIDQVKKPGKKKRSHQKSMKLFKISIAAFVKEVLKPSWRQGNMSKEAFKTIVKKTVDKVSGAMKSHRIPRSQTRINQYIDSSRGKLTKLVMGYVDKYVNV